MIWSDTQTKDEVPDQKISADLLVEPALLPLLKAGDKASRSYWIQTVLHQYGDLARRYEDLLSEIFILYPENKP